MSDGDSLIGKKFNKLTLLNKIKKNNRNCWMVKCDCGTTKIVRLSHLKNGHIKSCGCLRKTILDTNKFKIQHGHTKLKSESPEYISWKRMKDRCLNPNAVNYKDYGESGVKVCDRWLNFKNFYSDMGHRPKGTSLGRFKDKGNYEPGNCKWMTSKEQGENKKPRFQ